MAVLSSKGGPERLKRTAQVVQTIMATLFLKEKENRHPVFSPLGRGEGKQVGDCGEIDKLKWRSISLVDSSHGV